MTRQTSRRRFLKATAATGAVAGLNVAVLARGQGQNEEVILLGGRVGGWQGYRLAGEQEPTESNNPTMTLQAGTTYTLIWQNADGAGHNFAIRDSEGNNLRVLQPLSVDEGVFQQINGTDADQTVSLSVSDGNVTGVATDDSDGDTTGGNGISQQTTVPEEQLVERTSIVYEEGAVQAVRFTASSEMAQYVCLVHPSSMVGDVSVEGGDGGTGNSSSG